MEDWSFLVGKLNYVGPNHTYEWLKSKKNTTFFSKNCTTKVEQNKLTTSWEMRTTMHYPTTIDIIERTPF